MTTETQQMLAQLGLLHDDMVQLPAELRGLHAAALSQYPNNHRTYYVNQVNGDDDNYGSLENPFQSMNRAAGRTPKAGMLQLHLLSDYHLTDREVFDQAVVRIERHASFPTRPALTFAGVAANDANTMPEISSMQGVCYMDFSSIKFVPGTADVGVTQKGMVKSRGDATFRFIGCDFDVQPGTDQVLIHNEVLCSLVVRNTNSGFADMAGRWINGGASGADPATVEMLVATNLATL